METKSAIFFLSLLILGSTEGRRKWVNPDPVEYEYDDAISDLTPSDIPQPRIFLPWQTKLQLLFPTTTVPPTTQATPPANNQQGAPQPGGGAAPPAGGATPPAGGATPPGGGATPPGGMRFQDQIFYGYAPFSGFGSQQGYDMDEPFRRRAPQFQPIVIFRQHPGFGYPFYG